MCSYKVSVVVPVYKVPEEYLKTCINSIREQSLKEIEIILVDDGSPDDCGEILDQFGELDERIKVIHKENGGLASARNFGYWAVSSKWFMFVDADDWIEPNMCEIMYLEAEKNDVEVLLCGLKRNYPHREVDYKFYLEDKKIYLDSECKWLQEQLLRFDGNIAFAPAKLYKKEILESYNIEHDEKLRQGAEGLDFNIRLFEVLTKVEFLNIPLYHYRYNQDSLSSSHNEKEHQDVIRCYTKIKKYISTSINRDALIPLFNNRLQYVIIATAISGYFSPQNTESFRTKRKKYMLYLQQPIVKEALFSNESCDLSTQRKIVRFLIRNKFFMLINLLGKVRKWQKLHAR